VNTGKTARLIDSMDYEDVSSKRERLFKASVIVVCAWTVIEAPLELGGSADLIWLIALVTSKVLVGLTGMLAVANFPFARQVFTFICAASVFALAPALPLEYTRGVAVAILSTVECVGKAACVASFSVLSLAGSLGSDDLRSRSRTAIDPE
jgi:hypothetical protein